MRESRRVNRPALEAFERDPFTPKKLRKLCGSLSPLASLSIGSSVGQIPEGQISSTNLLFNTFDPQLPAGGSWNPNGAVTLTISNAPQWNAGFIAVGFGSTNGAAGFFDNATIVALPATQYTVQGQFSVTNTLLTNLGGVQPASNRVRMAVNWTGGVAREDSIDFNPATGEIYTTSAGVTNINISTFQGTLDSAQVGSTTPRGAHIFVVQVTFTTPATPAATNAGDFRLYPMASTAGTTGRVACGGFQVETGTVATTFVSTLPGATNDGHLGLLPRYLLDLSSPQIFITAAAANRAGNNTDCGTSYIINTNGAVFGLGTAPDVGHYVDVYFIGTTFCSIQATSIVGPGLPVAGVAVVTIPFDGTTPAGGIGPYNCFAARFTLRVNTPGAEIWEMAEIGTTHGTILFTANGNFAAGFGLTAIWVDGAGGGGGGGGAAAVNSAAGGGNGGNAVKDKALITVPGTTYAITIGAKGNGGAAGNNNGTAGGNTTIGALLTINGGTFGNGAASGAVQGPQGFPAANSGAGSGSIGMLTTVANYGGQGGGNLFSAPQLLEAFGSNPNGSAAGSVGGGLGQGGTGGVSGTVGGAAAAGGDGTAGFASIRW